MATKVNNNDWCPNGDYRRLNTKIIHVTAPTSVFLKINLVKVHYQIPMAVDDFPKTVTITQPGLCDYFRILFDLRNATQTFRRSIDDIFRDLNFVYVYVDDWLMASLYGDSHLTLSMNDYKNIRLLYTFRNVILLLAFQSCHFRLCYFQFFKAMIVIKMLFNYHYFVYQCNLNCVSLQSFWISRLSDKNVTQSSKETFTLLEFLLYMKFLKHEYHANSYSVTIVSVSWDVWTASKIIVKQAS